MTASLSPQFAESFERADITETFFSEDEKDDLRDYEKREQAPLGDPKSSCNTNIFFGFFFDGRRNNYVKANSTKAHSNIARLYDCFPGESVPGVLPEDTDWKHNASSYNNFFRVYVPGVASPFKQVKDSGEGFFDATLGGGAGRQSNERIVWALALQLLPSESYKKGWLKIKDERGKVVQTLPNADPYSEIYLKRNEWWGLVDERWLTAKDGLSIKWDEFVTNIKLAQEFHREIKSTFHKNTFVYYGAGDKKQASFETIEWKVSRGITPSSANRPTQNELLAYRHDQVRTGGSNLIYIGGETVFMPTTGYMATTSSYETSFWKIICEFQDGRGDGTVPASSGSNPRLAGGKNVRQQFRLSGFSHEPSYKDVTAQRVTHYAITKISTLADLS